MVIKRRRRWVALAVVLAFVLALVTAVYVWDRTKRAAFERKLAALRARGIPTTPAEMHAQYRLPAGVVDCTAIWQEGFLPFAAPDAFANFQNVPIIGSSGQDPPLPGTAWSDLAAAEAALAHFQHSLDCFHRAAEHGGHAQFPLRFDDGVVSEQVKIVRYSSRFLRLEAYARAHRGDRRRVAESLRHMSAIGRAIEHEPDEASFLVTEALDNIAIGTTEGLWPSADFTDDELLALQRKWENIDPFAKHRRSFQGERICGLTEFVKPNLVLESEDNSVLRRVPVLRWSDRLIYLELMGQIEEAIPESSHKLQPGDIVSLRQVHQHKDARLESRFMRTLAPITVFQMRATTLILNYVVRYETRRLCIVTALAAERYRRQTGHWPAAVGDLAPDFLEQIPLDPVDGKELRLLPQGDGLLVYGVGSDEVDNGGQRTADGKGPDCGFFIAAPDVGQPEKRSSP